MGDSSKIIDKKLKTILERELYKSVKQNSVWFICIVILMTWPGFAYSLMNNLVLGMGGSFSIRCKIPELSGTNWSFQQIKAISQPLQQKDGDCLFYNYDYKKISKLNYEEAKKYTDEIKNVTRYSSCRDNFIIKSLMAKSVTEQFHSGCKNKAEKIAIVFPSICSFMTGFLVSVFGDLYGRKRIISWGGNSMLMGAVVVTMANCIEVHIFGGAMIECGYIIMNIGIEAIILEIMKPFVRRVIFLLKFYGIALGLLLNPLLIIQNMHWKYIHLILSCSLLLIPVIVWYIPESPRFFLARNKKRKTWEMLSTMRDAVEQNELLYLYRNDDSDTKRNLKNNLNELKRLVHTKQFHLMWYLMFVSALAFYDNNRWRQIIKTPNNNAYSKIVDVFSKVSGIIVCLPLFLVFGKKMYFMYLLLFSSIVNFVIQLVQNRIVFYNTLIFINKMLSSQLLVLSTLHVAETIPTTIRCTCNGLLGYSLKTVAHLLLILITSLITEELNAIFGLLVLIAFVLVIVINDLDNDELVENMAEFIDSRKQ